MKNLHKLLIMTVFCSLAVALFAYAEEEKLVKGATAPKQQVAPPADPAAEAKMAELTRSVEAMAPMVTPETHPKTTLDNLQTAFNGESNANARYLAFAKQADAEGYGKAASLFRAAARAEQVHFERHAKAIKELGSVPIANIETPVVKSTKENLKAAMEGEIYESTVMYPEFLATAENEGNKSAVDAFEDAGKAEAVHASLYKSALGNLKAWKGKGKDFYVCLFCGNVVEKINFKACPICGKSRHQYMAVK